MNRDDLQRIARLRVKEARVLLENGYFSGAYYLLGYAVECALKACIAKQIKRYDFPDRKLINDSYSHELEKLLSVSGLKAELQKEIRNNPKLEVNWAIVKDWSVESRYSTDISETTARDFYSAVTTRKNGVLSWLKKWW
jgi:HEPN domain-containing protein